MKKFAALFDLDGVIINTEPQYDVFWKKIGDDYNLGIDHFERIVKGTTLPNILNRYFSGLSKEKQQDIVQANREFDLQMSLELIPGVLEFIYEIKEKCIKTGLVTSSDNIKLKRVFEELKFDHLFDTVVSADRITEGKPNPMCYLLAAKDLNISPEQCIVFEDSFQGIDAGNFAGMKVIGLSTTNPEEAIKDKVYRVIPDFQKISVNDLFL